MTKLEIFNTLMEKAKAAGYEGSEHKCDIGKILDGTNYYAIIFREDFAKAVWGSPSVGLNGNSNIPKWKWVLEHLVVHHDKWKFLEDLLDAEEVK